MLHGLAAGSVVEGQARRSGPRRARPPTSARHHSITAGISAGTAWMNRCCTRSISCSSSTLRPRACAAAPICSWCRNDRTTGRLGRPAPHDRPGTHRPACGGELDAERQGLLAEAVDPLEHRRAVGLGNELGDGPAEQLRLLSADQSVRRHRTGTQQRSSGSSATTASEPARTSSRHQVTSARFRRCRAHARRSQEFPQHPFGRRGAQLKLSPTKVSASRWRRSGGREQFLGATPTGEQRTLDGRRVAVVAAHEEPVAQRHASLRRERRRAVGLTVGDDMGAQVRPSVRRPGRTTCAAGAARHRPDRTERSRPLRSTGRQQRSPLGRPRSTRARRWT